MLKVALLCAGVAAQQCARVATDKSGLKKRHILSAVGGFYAGHVVVSQLGRRKSDALAALEFDIFERFAYPSMAAQSDDAFEWLVYASIGAPPRVLEGARRLLDGHPGFHLIVVDRKACAAEGRRTPEFWPLGDQLELLGSWTGLATRERDNLVLLTTRLEATDALPVNAVASIKDGAVKVPASFPKEAAAVRLLCWASSRTLDLAGGFDVAEAAMAPEACARTGLTHVLTSQAIAKAKGSVFRFFPARARRKMWTVVLEGRRSSAPLAVVSSANGAPAPAAPPKQNAMALPRLAAAYNVSTSARDLAALAAREKTLRPAPCDLAGDCLAAIVLLSDADARGPTLAALRASFLDHVAREGGKRVRIFKGSSLGRCPLVSADVWTSDHLSGTVSERRCYLRDARARHAHVAATSNHHRWPTRPSSRTRSSPRWASRPAAAGATWARTSRRPSSSSSTSTPAPTRASGPRACATTSSASTTSTGTATRCRGSSTPWRPRCRSTRTSSTRRRP
jgi:hypothetical protein